MGKRRDWPEGLSEDDPNYELAKRFYLEAWSDSHGLVADGFAGRLTLSDFLEGCVKTFSQAAAAQVQFKDTTPIQARCRELDRMATLHIRKLKSKFAAAPKRLRKPLAAALDEYSRKVNEIAARSKHQILLGELGKESVPKDSGTPINSEQAERARIRQEIVMPILSKKRWTRGRWAIEAGVGKNSVYEYLDGKRNLSPDNREAMAQVIDLKPEDLPE